MKIRVIRVIRGEQTDQTVTRQITWWIIFALLFIATQDYLFIGSWPERLILGLPVWLFYFILVHLAFILAIYRYSTSRPHPPE